jgi:arabinofuranosyltransferase
MDLGLVFAPALLYSLWQVKSPRSVWMLVLGQTPFVLWVIFSLWYYGFPFPNSAYAKLNTGIPQNEYFYQGWLYLKYSLARDPVTFLGIAISAVLAVGHPERKTWLPGLGGLLYLLYILGIGGDFMAGRFLTVPLLCFLISALRTQRLQKPGRAFGLLVAAVLFTGLLLPPTTTFYAGPLTWEEREFEFIDGIADERAFYAVGTSVLNYQPGRYPAWPWVTEGLEWRQSEQTLYITDSVGMRGFFAGPGVHIIDSLAITDPLLARLPAKERHPWRIGHFERAIPAGYIESALGNGNVIVDEELALYHDRLIELTQGDLTSPTRLASVVKINLGAYDGLIDRDYFRFIDRFSMTFEEAGRRASSPPLKCDDLSALQISDTSEIDILSRTRLYDPTVEVSLNGRSRYRMNIFSGENLTGVFNIPAAATAEENTIVPRQLNLPDWAYRQGYTRINLYPISGIGPFCFGYLVTRR